MTVKGCWGTVLGGDITNKVYGHRALEELRTGPVELLEKVVLQTG